MQVTEQNKQEAEKVVEKHTFVSQIQRIGISKNVYQQTNKIDAINHAIQDRQSVLEALYKVGCIECQSEHEELLYNINEQINYLQSKL